MSNVEIYDSSNSQLSSDEYSHDEDDDALMDVAVSKQTPAKSAKSKSNDSSPTKTDSTSTTPRKLSDDLDATAAAASTKPPSNREHTQRQIKQMQRDIQANLYFKRRSIKWLNQRVSNKIDYMSQLRRALPKIQAQARRMAEYRAAKRAIERKQQTRQQERRRSGRTPSRSHSRSHTGSLSPELICLDDTENEDSPEKPTDTPAAGNQPQQQVASKTPPPFTLQLEIESEATPAENGSVLDEFLTMKPAIAAEPIIEEAAGCNNSIQQQQQQEMQMLPALDLGYKAAIESRASLDMPLEEATLKRRRSVTPPSTEPHVDKRTKSLPTQDMDDDIIEFSPVYATPAKQAATAQQVAVAAAAQLPRPTPPTAPLNKPSISQAAVAQLLASRSNTESPSSTSVLKLGSPFTLTPSSDMDFYAQKKTMHQSQAVDMAAISYSLETPTPPVEAMEIVYPNEKSLADIKTSAEPLAQTASAPAVIQQQAAHEAHIFATPYAHQQQQQQQQPPQQQQPAQQHQQPPQQQPQQAQQQQPAQQQLPPRPKQRSESNSRQTQTIAAPASAQPRNKSSVDLNNSNSDAVFHQRVKELYTELDEIMSDKVRAVKPELKSYANEKQRIEADIKTLDNLITQKEEEHNRLLHLRCIKEELLARIERKERILIMKEILPSILNKNCSTSELYEMHALLHNEQNAPMPSRHGSSAVEQLINRVENGLDDLKILRGALGLQEKSPSCAELSMPPPPPQHYETQQLHRRNSVPAMRASLPPIVGDRSSIYGRSAAVHEDYRREQPEELLGKPNKLQPPQSRYQQLINESKQLTGSATDLAASSSYRQQPPDARRSQTNSLDNHFDNEMPLKPLYNSSPLAAGNQRKSNDTNKQYNEVHSMYRRAELLQGLDSLDRGSNPNNRNSNNNISKRMGSTMNGPEELERRCQQCERYKATYMCAGCQNQWYCSRECQVRAWDTHWESCPN
ncbi:mediator of RNA polymerase II transcription subunit 15 [Drosophila novamexicana]|uniref:mediator of RNA polymerase II transcription subunit 15 n=1 Tax=Drosophila novamexicana TaxID=47314 RepID=UPI0011E6070A|nr:mediator of RNA polymerase II transcription subunit 15 [Drosophila novamexicana]